MKICPRILCAAALLSCAYSAAATAMDWPVTLGFQLGFAIRVVPAANDASNALGLVVATDKILTDRAHSLLVTGTITNFSDAPRDDIAMRFAVTSYIGTGADRGSAVVEPRSLPPGGTAAFTARISLHSERPRLALYAVTAGAPVPYASAQPLPTQSPAASIPDYALPLFGESTHYEDEIPVEAEGPPEIPGF